MEHPPKTSRAVFRSSGGRKKASLPIPRQADLVWSVPNACPEAVVDERCRPRWCPFRSAADQLSESVVPSRKVWHSSPMRAMRLTSSSPAVRNLGGVRLWPTPPGVPQKTMSSGSTGVALDRPAINSVTPTR